MLVRETSTRQSLQSPLDTAPRRSNSNRVQPILSGTDRACAFIQIHVRQWGD